VASTRQEPTQLGFAAKEPFVKTNYLHHKFLLARYLTMWAVSPSHAGKVEEVESRVGELSCGQASWRPLCRGWHRGTSVGVGGESLDS